MFKDYFNNRKKKRKSQGMDEKQLKGHTLQSKPKPSGNPNLAMDN
jgi:hypothetical protein